jgi:hypothetical protein
MTRLALVAVLSTGCGVYIGVAQPPRLTATRQTSVQVLTQGPLADTVARAVDWVLTTTSSVKRVRDGGELLRLEAMLEKEQTILGGSDLNVAMRAWSSDNDPGETRNFRRRNVTSNVSVEVERLVTEAVVWALERAAAGPPAPGEPPPVAAPAAVQPEPSAPPPEEPAPTPKKKTRRRL